VEAERRESVIMRGRGMLGIGGPKAALKGKFNYFNLGHQGEPPRGFLGRAGFPPGIGGPFPLGTFGSGAWNGLGGIQPPKLVGVDLRGWRPIFPGLSWGGTLAVPGALFPPGERKDSNLIFQAT